MVAWAISFVGWAGDVGCYLAAVAWQGKSLSFSYFWFLFFMFLCLNSNSKFALLAGIQLFEP
jgi:hypothetical protein